VPHLVATEPERTAGRFTGRVAGIPCFREGKIARVDAWLAGQGALAWCAVDRSREADPDYGLAGVLAEALTSAVPPSSWDAMADDTWPGRPA